MRDSVWYEAQTTEEILKNYIELITSWNSRPFDKLSSTYKQSVESYIFPYKPKY